MFGATTPDQDDETILARLFQGTDGEKYKRLFSGSKERYRSASEADQALCHGLTRYTKDRVQIDRVFRKSGLYRPKWDEFHGAKTYAEITMDAAFEFKASGKFDEGLKLVPVSELVSAPPEEHAWILEGILPTAGISVLASKPKVGKSTLALNFAVAVSRGNPFLGRPTKRSQVIYLGLSGEVKASELATFFRLQGINDDRIYTFTELAPTNLFNLLKHKIREFDSPLVIIDTLAKAIRMRDFNDYGEVTKKLSPYAGLAREMGGHIMFLHHSRKGTADDPTDSALGSTAIVAGVDTFMILERHDQRRTLKSIQRYGQSLEGLLLQYDSASMSLTSLGDVEQHARSEVSRQIIDLLSVTPRVQLTLEEIREQLGIRRQTVLEALAQLCDLSRTTDRLVRLGSGIKGDAYRYTLGGNSGIESLDDCGNSGTE